MHVDGDLVQPAGDLRRVVAGVVVDEDDFVDVVLRHDLGVSALDGRCGVVRRHHDDDFLVLVHAGSADRSWPG